MTDTSVRPAGTAAEQLSPVRYWNDVLLDVMRETGGAPGPLARTAAMMHGAIFDVINNQARVDGSLPATPYVSYLGTLPARRGAPVADAVNVAARDVLIGVHPASEPTVAKRFAALYPPDAPPVNAPLGRAAARAMLRARAHDRSEASPRYVPSDEPGAWRPTEPGRNAVTPHWGRVTPFGGGAGSTFRPPAPGGTWSYKELLATELYAQQVAEVTKLGGRDSLVRTDDQTEAAWFWANDLDGTYKPPGHLLQITAELAPPLELIEEARLFALMSFALADAMITAWDSKYDTPIDLWRPASAIRLADTDGNPRTAADPQWEPLSADRQDVSFSPAFPAYVSGHATVAGAWAGILRRFFGTDDVAYTASSEDPHVPPGTTRSFTSFTEAAVENARSRIYLGVHYQFDADGGVDAGEAVARHIFRTQFYARD